MQGFLYLVSFISDCSSINKLFIILCPSNHSKQKLEFTISCTGRSVHYCIFQLWLLFASRTEFNATDFCFCFQDIILQEQTHQDTGGPLWFHAHGWHDFPHGSWCFHGGFLPAGKHCFHPPVEWVWINQYSSENRGCLHQQNSTLFWPQGTSTCTSLSLTIPWLHARDKFRMKYYSDT